MRMTPFYKHALWPITMAEDVFEATPTPYLADFHKQVQKKMRVMRDIQHTPRVVGSVELHNRLIRLHKQLSWSLSK